MPKLKENVNSTNLMKLYLRYFSNIQQRYLLGLILFQGQFLIHSSAHKTWLEHFCNCPNNLLVENPDGLYVELFNCTRYLLDTCIGLRYYYATTSGL